MPPKKAAVETSERTLERPIVRSFRARFEKECAAHVRAGGHGVLWESETRARLVVPAINEDDPHDLGFWAILDMGKQRWAIEHGGPLDGLATTRIPKSCFELVKRRTLRDSEHPGAKRTMVLDCLECGACCRDNNVILEPQDFARFAAANRAELGKPPYTKKADGKIVFKLAPDKACRHLQGDNKCAIYPVRPDACSTFPMASECCLFARESELGVYDGVRE